jgi:hypothetical protein
MPSFDHSAILWWGLPLAAAPLLIHLISRLRHRVVRWAAMEFLLASQRKSRTRVLLRQLLLLALRTLIVAGVVLALAEPRWRRSFGGLLGGAPTSHLVVLDDSYSMADRSGAAEGGSRTAFDRGREVVERLVADLATTPGRHEIAVARSSTLATGTTVDLLPRRPVAPEAVAAVRDALARAGVSSATRGCRAAVEAAGTVLDGGEDRASVLWMVADFRDRDWLEPIGPDDPLRRVFDAGTELRLVDAAVDRGRPGNLGLVRLEVAGGVPAAGVLVPMEVEVRNDGPDVARDVVVELREDGGGRPVIRIDEIPAGQTAIRRFDVRFSTPGSHVVEASLPADILPDDDVRWSTIDVVDGVDVLVIDGDPRGPAASGDGFYVASALAPGGAATGLRPRVEPTEALATADLSRFDCIWLLDVPRLAAAEMTALERYARDGGGVVFFCGPRTRADVVNSAWHRGGDGLFPVPLAGAVELLPAAGDTPVPDVLVEDHPVVAVLAGQRNPLLDAVKVERFWAVDRGHDPRAAGGRRLLSVRTGQPLAVERRFGDGTVVAVLTSAAPVWNNWARGNPSWVVVLLEMESYLARARRGAETVTVGGDVDVRLAAGTDEADVEFLVPPDGSVVRQTAVTEATGGFLARLRGAETPGVYEARWRRLDGAAGGRRIAVNVDPDEGRLERAGREGLAATLAGIPFRYDRADSFSAAEGGDGAASLAGPLLLAVAALLLVEQVVAYAGGYHASPAPRRTS